MDAQSIQLKSIAPPTATPTATSTATSTATPTSTPTATPTPTTQADDSIAGLTLSSGEPGILTVTWNAADPPPGDYRVNWANADEEFPSRQESDGNAFPTSTSYTISNLEPGVEYKVRVRARYFDGNGNRVSSGPWSASPSLTVSREELLRQNTDGPAVTIAGSGGINSVGGVNHVDGADFDVTVTFSAAVGDTFDHTDLTVTNARNLRTSDFVAAASGPVYTATIRPQAGFNGILTVQVPASVAQDADNQDNQPSNVFSATVSLQSACVTGGAVSTGDAYASLARDCSVLLGLYDTLVYTSTLVSSWSANTAIDNWRGITLSNDRVSEISLPEHELSSSLPPALAQLTELTKLDLDHNMLTGGIPVELGNLAELDHLDLEFNSLSGSIPSQLGNLANLKELRLGFNQLSGAIPDSLGNLSALEVLILSDANYDSQLPASLSQLSSLQVLEVSNGMLKGPMLDISAMTSLPRIVLNFHSLTGSIPSLSALTNLQYFHIIGNELSGTIPDPAGLTSLQDFAVSSNRLTGSIPTSLPGLDSLRYLALNNNNLTGTVPDFSNHPRIGTMFLQKTN